MGTSCDTVQIVFIGIFKSLAGLYINFQNYSGFLNYKNSKVGTSVP